MSKKVFLLLIKMVCVGIAFSQPGTSLNIGKLKQVDGLSSPNIRKIITDKAGFIWVATQDGLNRFDGISVIHFNEGETDKRHVTLGNDFHDIVYDSTNNCLWAATSNGGLTQIDITTCVVTKRLALDTRFTHNGNLWYKSLYVKGDTLFGCVKEGFFFTVKSSTGQLLGVTDVSLLVKHETVLNKVFADNMNRIWLCTDKEIILLNATATRVITTISYNQNIHQEQLPFTINDYTIYKSRYLILATSFGCKAFDMNSAGKDTALETVLQKSSVMASEVLAITTHDNSLYISNTSGIFMYNLASGTISEFTNSENPGNKNWCSNVYALYTEHKRLWIGNMQGLFLAQNTLSPIEAFYSSVTDPNIHLDHCYGLFASNDTIIYTCTLDGLYQVNTNSKVISLIDGSKAFFNVFNAGDNKLFATTNGGIYTIVNGKTTNATIAYPELKAMEGDFVIANAVFRDSVIFLASQKRLGLYQWNIIKHTVTKIDKNSASIGLKSLEITSLLIDKNNRLLIVAYNVIMVYDFLHNKIEHHYLNHPVTKQPLDIFMDILPYEQGYYVAAYGKGLIETDKDFVVKKVIGTSSGLFSLGLYKIFICNDSLILATTNNGIFLYNILSQKIKQLTEQDGLQSNNFEQFSGYKTKAGVFVGGLHGISRITPSKFRINSEAPELHFTSIKTETSDKTLDTTNLFSNSFSLPNNWLQTNISFIGLNYSYPEKILYEYRIKELNMLWIKNNNKNFVNFIGLMPGEYMLQVRAANEDGYWSEPKQLTLIFLPKWYQTMLFKIVLLVLIAGIFYSLYRFRLNSLKKQQQIRQSISADLHDDIGGTLNSIKVFAHLAEISKDKEPYLVQIKESIKQATTGLRDMIWVLDDKHDTLENLIERLQQFALPVAASQNIQITIILDGVKDATLNKTEKRNFLLISKEAVNNAIKYSDCKKIHVVFFLRGKKLSLKITDDGNGFDIDNYIAGNGIRNIKERATQINYKAIVSSQVGKGTEISIII